MTKEELYVEYCFEYPMVQGYREVTYESWLEKQVIDSRTEVINKNAVSRSVSNRSFNELELLSEDLECVKMWLDNKNVPTHDKDNNQYSVIGRIELLLNGC